MNKKKEKVVEKSEGAFKKVLIFDEDGVKK